MRIKTIKIKKRIIVVNNWNTWVSIVLKYGWLPVTKCIVGLSVYLCLSLWAIVVSIIKFYTTSLNCLNNILTPVTTTNRGTDTPHQFFITSSTYMTDIPLKRQLKDWNCQWHQNIVIQLGSRKHITFNFVLFFSLILNITFAVWWWKF